MNELTPVSTGSGRGPFPFSLWYLLFVGVAGIGIYKTTSDVLFFAQTDPVVVERLDDVGNLEDNQLAEIHLKLDLDDAVSFEYVRTGDRYTVVPFEGTNRRVLFSKLGQLEVTDADPPYKGRVAAKGFSDDWDIGDGKDAKLDQVFDGKLPDNALVVYPVAERGISVWQWTITVVAGLFLIYTVFRFLQWVSGRS